MQGVVYVDVLVLMNGVIGAFLLRCTARLCSCPSPGGRLLAGAGLAGLSSLLLLLPPLPAALAWGLKLSTLAAVVAAAFPWQGVRWYARALAAFGGLNVLLAGAVMALAFWGGESAVQTNNLAVYFRLSPTGLILCVTGVYLAVQAFVWLFGPPARHPSAPFAVWFGSCQVTGQALLDTGFSLRDPLTGEDAFLLCFPDLAARLPKELAAGLRTYFETGQLVAPLRLVPCQTAGGVRALPAARATRLLVGAGGTLRAVRPTLAVFTAEPLAGGQFSAVVAADLGAPSRTSYQARQEAQL